MVERKQQAVIFDIDGTLADSSKRLHYLKPTEPGQKKDWKRFFRESVKDEVIPHVYYLFTGLSNVLGLKLILLTGRPESQRALTREWLENTNCPYNLLFMRRDDDRRPDYEVKTEIIKTQLKDYEILMAFEDRMIVAKALEDLGIPTLLTSSEWRTKEITEPVKSDFDNEEFREQSRIALGELNMERSAAA